MQSEEIDVLIVGAGPTGLTLACICRNLGLKIRLIEKKAARSTTSKAIGLQYRVSEILALLGIVDRFLEIGGSPTPVNIYEKKRKLVTFHFDIAGDISGQDAFRPLPILIPQSETERLLADLLSGKNGAIEWNVEFLQFVQDADRVRSRVRHADGGEEEIVSRYLLSCEGAHSVIRKQAGFRFPGKTYPLSFVLADVKMQSNLNHNENHVWMHADGSFAALPLPAAPDCWRLFFEMRGNQPAESEEVTLQLVMKLLAQRSGLQGVEIQDAIWLSEFKINCRMVDRFRNARVFVAGDAAHIHSPTGGQGITTGILDAINLGWKLSRVLKGAPDSLLDTYEIERLPKAKEVLEETDRTTTVFFSPSRAIRLLRDALILPLLRLKFVQRRMFGKLSQLHVNYRNSPLSRNEISRGRGSAIRAGDRAPDVAFEFQSSQERTTLFRLLQKGKPLLLTGPDSAMKTDWIQIANKIENLDIDYYIIALHKTDSTLYPHRWLLDIHRDFKRLYGASGDFAMLIRPDGHTGLVQKPMQVPGLLAYLKLIGW